MKKEDLLARATNAVSDYQTFQKLMLNGRYGEKRKAEFKQAYDKYVREADLLMKLAMHWND